MSEYCVRELYRRDGLTTFGQCSCGHGPVVPICPAGLERLEKADDHLDQAEVTRQIKSEGGRTWRRTIRITAEDWVADEEEK